MKEKDKLGISYDEKFNEGKEDAKKGLKPTEMTRAYIKGYNEGLIVWGMMHSQEDF